MMIQVENLINWLNRAKCRLSYAKEVRQCLLALTNSSSIRVADVGAGTGIWTRLLAQDVRVKSVDAVEPSDAMLAEGQSNISSKICWSKGLGEQTNLEADRYNLVTMASSFHWVDFHKGLDEFVRILKKGGAFAALWNPRYIQDSPLLVDIEKKVIELNPNVKRVSSGRSAFVEALTNRFASQEEFEPPVYIEGRHKVEQSVEQYIGAWQSVNDIQYQLGDKFEQFMAYIEEKTRGLSSISATYLTRCWCVKKK